MRNIPPRCVYKTTDSKIKFEENKRVIVFENPRHCVFMRVQVDGCAIKEGLRCDNLLISEDESSEYFVELKGTDIAHALQQLSVSIERLGQNSSDRHCYIVSTNQAPAFNTMVQRAKQKFLKEYKSELLLKEKRLSVKLN